MRFFLGTIVALAFVGAGLVPISGGIDMLSRGITGDKVYGSFGIGGMLILFGALIYIAARRGHNNRASSGGKTAGKISARAVATRRLDDFGDDGGE